jgi:hypothetical protein
MSAWFKLWFELSYHICGYFDDRPQIHVWLWFIYMIFKLPFHNKWWESECDCPSWWISIWQESTIIHLWWKWNMNGWNKSIYIYYPFINKKWYRSSVLLNNWTWESEYVWNRKYFYNDKWDSKIKKWEYEYTDKYDWAKIPTTIYIEEMEWRRKWLMWTPLFNDVRRYIEIEFSEEVWSRKWSWKW